MLEIVKQDYINDLLNNDITKKEASNDVNENNEVNANGKEKNANDDDEDNDTKDFKPDPPKCLSWYNEYSVSTFVYNLCVDAN